MSRYTPYWTILGLDKAPEDRRTVKKAYAKKLRETRPDDDPEGFMRLRDAHDMALDHIAHIKSQSEDYIAEELNNPPPINRDFTDIEGPAKQETAIEPVEVSSELSDGNFIETTPHEEGYDERKFPLEDELISLLDDDKKRYERDSWAAIFKQAHYLDIDDFSDFEDGLLNALLTRSGYFNYYQDEDEKTFAVTSQSIAASIFATLKWDETQLSSPNKAQQVSWLREKLIKPKYAVSTDDGYLPETPTNFWFRNVWWIIIVLIICLNVVRSQYE